MNPVHIHLLLNHVPVIGTIVAVALLAWGLLRRSDDTARAGLGLFAVLAVLGLVVYLTGEPAEHAVEDLQGFSHDAIEAHEEASFLATALLGALGVLALGGLVAFRRAFSLPRGFATLMLALSVIPVAAMGWTAYLGGQIRHSEIRGGGAPAAAEAEAGQPVDGAVARRGVLLPAGAAVPVMTAGSLQGARRGPEIPESMRIEHAELHEALVAATRAPGRVGAAARNVAKVLDPHFEREEQIALPPLGLLQSLARGDAVTEEMASVLPMTDTLAAELPEMLGEHERIRAALEELARVAREERSPEHAALAEKVMIHAEIEEQVNYPAAVLVGQVVRQRLGR